MGEDGGRYFLSQMLDTLEYLQSKSVVHRDLKLENILSDSDSGKVSIKLADFAAVGLK